MKRILAIMLLMVTLAGWLQAVCSAEQKPCCCCGESCACKAPTPKPAPACPCDCGKKHKQMESMPLTIAEWPEAMVAPEVRTPIPPVQQREIAPEELSLSALPALHRAPPNAPPGECLATAAPYTGFHRPLRA